MILGLHFPQNKNVGDKNCSPVQYFEFGIGTITADPRTLTVGDVRRATAVINGGGTMARWIAGVESTFLAAARLPQIAWGVGYSERWRAERHDGAEHAAAAQQCVLYGNRDWGTGVGEYVPCASCMHSAFDVRYPILHDVVFYGHAALSPLEGCTPRMTNATLDMDQVIAFLASGRTVVTSSYHGAYWATLLGRRVVVVPFGSKFYHLRHPVPLVLDWRAGMQRAAEYPEALAESRAINRAFYDRVMQVLV